MRDQKIVSVLSIPAVMPKTSSIEAALEGV